LSRHAIREAGALEQITVQAGLRIRHLQREAAGVLNESAEVPVAKSGRDDLVVPESRRQVIQRQVEEERLIVSRDVLVLIPIEDIVHYRITGRSWIGLADLGADRLGL